MVSTTSASEIALAGKVTSPETYKLVEVRLVEVALTNITLVEVIIVPEAVVKMRPPDKVPPVNKR